MFTLVAAMFPRTVAVFVWMTSFVHGDGEVHIYEDCCFFRIVSVPSDGA